jgi:DNA-binding NtrC family response regulator
MSSANILVIDDEPDIREVVSEILEDEGYKVSTAENGEAARSAFATESPDLVLLDIWMPDVDGITLLKEWSQGGLPCPVVVMSGHGTLETAVEATRLGAHDFVQKPISLAKLLSIVAQALESRKEQAGQKPAPSPSTEEELVGVSAEMQVLRQKAVQAAKHSSPVLITGEDGSGREVLARFIHHSAAVDGDFVTADHGDLGPETIRAALLGESNDAGTGLLDRAGGGTLYVPDIQDLPSEAVTVLNQVLESGHYSHEKSTSQIPLACRIIASGRVDLMNRVQKNPALEQLYYRLNVLPLKVTPLRERPDDVPELIRFYSDWFPNHENLPYRPFSVSAQNRLRNHSWPGNIRELRNLIQRLLILGGEGEVSVTEVDEALRQNPSQPAGETTHPEIFDLPLREAREQFEREYLTYQLSQTGGSVGKLAETVGMERTHLYRKLRALGIDPKAVARGGDRT